MHNLFENSPKIICTSSRILGIIGLALIPFCLLFALFSVGGDEAAALNWIFVALGGLAVFVSSIFTYAFGMLVRNSEKTDSGSKSNYYKDDELPEI